MNSLIDVYDSFLSEDLILKINKELNNINIKEYKNKSIKWIAKEVIKEKKVIKYSEKFSGIDFVDLSKDIRCNVAIKQGLIASDTQIHFDNKSKLNIVVPILMNDLEASGLIIFPYFSSFLLRPIVRFKFISKIIRKFKIIQFILKANNINYIANTGYIFKGANHAHGVFYRPKSKKSLRAVLTINFKKT